MEKKVKTKTWRKPHHKITFPILYSILKPYFRLFYKYKPVIADIPKDEACIIFSNHQTFSDQFLVGLSFKSPLYVMASERIFCLGFVSKIIRFIVEPIMKKKSKADIVAVKNCTKILKEGGKVLIFPEGNCTYDGRPCYISTAAAKMIKMLKAPLYFYNLSGGYGAKPRWGHTHRNGMLTGRIVGMLLPEDYMELTNEELNDKIVEALAVNELPPKSTYTSSRRAEYLEKVLYYCPECKSYQTLHSHGNYCTCEKCGLEVEYTVNLTFSANSNHTCALPGTVAEWYDLQASELLFSLNGKEGEIFRDEKTRLSSFGDGRTKRISKGEISITATTFTAGGSQFPLSSIESMTVQQNSAIIFYVDDVSYFVKGGKRFNPLKYMHAFYMLKHINEGGKYDEPIGNVHLGL